MCIATAGYLVREHALVKKKEQEKKRKEKAKKKREKGELKKKEVKELAEKESKFQALKAEHQTLRNELKKSTEQAIAEKNSLSVQLQMLLREAVQDDSMWSALELNGLPNDAILYIVSFCDIKDLLSLESVSQSWRSCLRCPKSTATQTVWHKLALKTKLIPTLNGPLSGIL